MIMNMAGGGGKGLLQVKTASPTESSQIILPDTGYDGLSKVNINAIPTTYVGSGVSRDSGGTYYPSTSTQTVAYSGHYLTGNVNVQGDSALIPSNIKKGSSIFGVNGSYEGEGGYSGNYLNIENISQGTTVFSTTFNNINTGYSREDFFMWRSPEGAEGLMGYILMIENNIAIVPKSGGSSDWNFGEMTKTVSKGINSVTVTIELPSDELDRWKFYPGNYYCALFTHA